MFTVYTSKHLAKEAKNFALKSMPTKHAIPATNAAKVAAYLDKKKCQLEWTRQHGTVQKLDTMKNYRCWDCHRGEHGI